MRFNPFRVGTEAAYQNVLLTCMERKPPSWLCETVTDSGKIVRTVLRKQPRGQWKWDVLLPNGGVHSFKMRREALDFINQLEVLKGGEDESA